MAELKDSGGRREFLSGAVRDMAEGKGRCDLLPLEVVADFLDDGIIALVASYVRRGNEDDLLQAINLFILKAYDDPYTAVLELSKHYEDGARKYKERNWEQGLPLHCYIDSGVRHYLKWLRGDKDEPHDRAIVWNLSCAVWTQRYRPECIDLPFAEKK